MPLNPNYESKIPDISGNYHYDREEHSVWRDLFTRQATKLEHHASEAYLNGLRALGLEAAEIPQVQDLDNRLRQISGAGVKGVEALIPQDQFSTLLSERRFPVATFIRRREDIDYLEEPDIFHEVFGHAPMLTNRDFCQFLERFGRLALALDAELLPHLFRLFWFTVEFGLIREHGTTKVYGAGIVSSPSELAHVVASDAEVLPFELETVLRTPYRIDIVQPLYFEIGSFQELAECLGGDIEKAIRIAMSKGDLPPRFDVAA